MAAAHPSLTLKDLQAVPELMLSMPNYPQWKFTATALIRHFDFMPFFRGEVPEPPNPNPDPNVEVIGAPEHIRRQRVYEQWQARRNDAALFLTHSCRSDLDG